MVNIRELPAGEFLSAAPATTYPLVNKADADLPGGLCRALWVGTAGTANLMQDDGMIQTNVPLFAGLNPLSCRQVRLGGTATDIRALY